MTHAPTVAAFDDRCTSDEGWGIGIRMKAQGRFKTGFWPSNGRRIVGS
jgi:ribulose bisphosphate carboxylase small subunit